MIRGGDFVNGDGIGVMSAYGSGSLADENFTIKHVAPGLLKYLDKTANGISASNSVTINAIHQFDNECATVLSGHHLP